MTTDTAPNQSGNSTPSLRISGYTKRFDDNLILNKIDLEIMPGEFTVIVGRSGCGKSTLLRSIAGFDGDYGGSISYEGTIGFGFQDSRYLPWRRVWQNIVLGVPGRRRDMKKHAEVLLGQVGLREKADQWPSTLSGGEVQRMALARMLSKKPSLVLLDEPFGAIDALTRIRIQALLEQVWKTHALTVVMVTHDIDEAVALGDRIVVLKDGRLARDVRVDLPRPRKREGRRFDDLKTTVLQELDVLDDNGLPRSVEEGVQR